MTESKVYQRQFNPSAKDSLALIAKQINNECRVLDLGCGAGDLGEYLRHEKNCVVIGVENDLASIDVAKQKLNDVIQLDLSTESLAEALPEKFDVIVMADIIEHIYDPSHLLKAVHHWLQPDGKCLISIPNAGYVGALMGLYDDEWNYREEGILDRTHVRFYTKKSIIDLLAITNFDAVVCDRVKKDLTETEFTQRLDCLSNNVRDWLLAKPEGAAYQFIIEARPQSQKYPFPVEVTAPSMSCLHIVKCYWQDDLQASFTPDKYCINRGIMGGKNRLLFPVSSDKLAKIRLDFSDRRSTYRIEEINIFDKEEIIWSSATSDNQQVLLTDAVSHQKSLPMTCCAMSNNANLTLELTTTQQGEQLTIEVIMLAPVDPQNMAFLNAVPVEQHEKSLSENKQLLINFMTLQKETQQRIEALEKTAADAKEQLLKQQQMTEQSLLSLQSESAQKTEQIENLLQSSSWKMTAPLRKITKILKKS